MFEAHVKTGFSTNLKHLRITEAQTEFVKGRMTVMESDCNVNGMLHGGQISTIVDVISTFAIILRGRPRGVSVEMNISFLRPARLGEEINIHSYSIKTGRSLATALVDISNSEEKDQLSEQSDQAALTPEKNLASDNKQDDKDKNKANEIVKPKKKINVLTFKSDRLTSEKGLYAVVNDFPQIEFRGDGHEKQDLKLLMKKYEHWGNRLFPRLRFSDLLERIETFGSKKEIKDCLGRIRKGGRVPWSSGMVEDLDDPIIDIDNVIGIRNESVREIEQELISQEINELAQPSNEDIDEMFELAGFD
ncbi:TIMELESS-interacting protein [Oopsacas minuta]|uniref:TIMELESS-interacting protein n=1 Tax=Oopsacas minuta TaxID=111878 RepID=A0AAV7JD62_9METZ|nr:TIMELESS-interacting protein [Oopsacas minuta]